ncbi:MAG: ATP-binding protein [Verrucomicrobiota bacterium]
MILQIGSARAQPFSQSQIIQSEIKQLRTELQQLPQTSLNLTPWTLGYRSDPSDTPESDIEIIVQFQQSAPVDLIVLMPSSYTDDGQELKVYCFPERFMIERLYPDGTSDIVVDYRDQDYPIRGIEPQLFSIPEPKPTSGLRLTVTRMAENPTWVLGAYRTSISELFAFAGNWNVALNQQVSSNSTSTYSYIWTPAALVDGFSLFSPVNRDPKNPNLIPLRIRNVDTVELTFDLARESPIDEYRFWPLLHDLQFNYPPTSGIGFPRGLKIEVADQADFNDSRTVFDNDMIYPATGSNPLMLSTQPVTTRYVKVTLSNIVHDYRTGITELAIDEIQFFSRGTLVSQSVIPRISGTAVPEAELKALTDGQTTEGEILAFRPWLIDLSRRAEITRKLDTLERELELTRSVEKERLKYLAMLAIGLAIILGLMIWLAILMSERRWNRIRERIACDIHDDLGANIISIAHSIELLEHCFKNPSARENRILQNAMKTAHQTARDTRQIVHLLERNEDGILWTDHLHGMIENLVGEKTYAVQLDEKQAFNRLNSAHRWDLQLFIKEAINNVIKHAEARHVTVLLQKRKGGLRVMIEDDGQGIPETKRPVRHLQRRAENLKGNLQLKTAPGRGTRIILDF